MKRRPPPVKGVGLHGVLFQAYISRIADSAVRGLALLDCRNGILHRRSQGERGRSDTKLTPDTGTLHVKPLSP